MMFRRFWLPGPVQLAIILLITLGLLALLWAAEPESARDAPQSGQKQTDPLKKAKKAEKKVRQFWQWLQSNSPLKGGDE